MQTMEESDPIHRQESFGSKTFTICGRVLNCGAIAGLAAVNVFLFLQLQAVTYKVAEEQNQLDEIKDNLKTQQNQTVIVQEKVEEEHSLTIIHMGGTFVLITCLITMFHMTAHLQKWNEPIVQTKIIAILWMSPIYGVTSFLSLLFPVAHEYMMIIKDFYEAYCIYQFLSFLIAVLGRGDRDAVVDVLARHADHLKPPYKCLNCFYHPSPDQSDRAMSNAVLLECQILAMQFVFFRPFTSILNFVIDAVEQYTDKDHNDDDDGAEDFNQWAYFASPKFLVLMIQNVSVFFAFAGLLKFYHAIHEDLQWCQPFKKFLCIKGVVFMTFWQGLAITIFFYFVDVDDDSAIAVDDQHHKADPAQTIQNILICLEMLFFALAHWCIFPKEEWEEGYRRKQLPSVGIGFADFVSDVKVVINSGKASRARKKMKREGLDAIPLRDDDYSNAIPTAENEYIDSEIDMGDRVIA
mmetsp:Transcript_27882/g.42690  ORF Transcript_27882/g.42690 Transcript_27882/m.42690 type:complete len:465 (-) Transcript_27882:1587-2981(-)